MAITLVQSAQSTGVCSGPGQSAVVTLSAPVTAGNLVFVLYGSGNGYSSAQVSVPFTDSLGDTYSAYYNSNFASGTLPFADNFSMFCAEAASSGSCTITAPLINDISATVPYTIVAAEFSGFGPVSGLVWIDGSPSISWTLTTTPTMGGDLFGFIKPTDQLLVFSAAVGYEGGGISWLWRVVTGPGHYSDTLSDPGGSPVAVTVIFAQLSLPPPDGVRISKANVYAALGPAAGLEVTKANVYAAVDEAAARIAVTKANAYAALAPAGLMVSKGNIYAALDSLPGPSLMVSKGVLCIAIDGTGAPGNTWDGATQMRVIGNVFA